MNRVLCLSAIAICTAALVARGETLDKLIIPPSDLRISPPGTFALSLWPQRPLTPRVPSPNNVEPRRQAVPKDWIPKEFNGMRFFIVPIDARAAIPLTPR